MEGLPPIVLILGFLTTIILLYCAYVLLGRSVTVVNVFRPYWKIMDSRDRLIVRVGACLAGLTLAAVITYFWWHMMSNTLGLPH
jgi:hypothetical protein